MDNADSAAGNPRRSSNDTVARALQVLMLFQAKNDVGLREIARDLGLSVAVVHRILETLADFRFVRQVPESKRYVLGSTVLELAQRFRDEDRFAQACIAIMDDLRDQTSETVALHVLRDGKRINVLESRSPEVLRQVASPGASMPLTHGAIDIVMRAVATEPELAKIDEVLAASSLRGRLPTQEELQHFTLRGWALSNGARTPGATGLATLVPHPEGVYVLAVHGPHDRVHAAGIDDLATMLLTAASRVRDAIANLHASL